VYVDGAADRAMAAAIVLNAKTQRPGVCNAMETLLVDQAIAPEFLPAMARQLMEKKVELRLDEASRAILQGQASNLKTATEEDWYAEYLDLILAVRVVDGVPGAIAHINQYGSAHSDTIVTSDEARARQFLAEVDSAAVYWNASTRFTDGGEFGMGAEIGISTDKIGARGPMGLEELTTYKWLGFGSGQVRG
jgi:glutamate-5-semialdehyde dehydrogenase